MWDETLLASEPFSIEVTPVRKTLQWLKAGDRFSDGALRYLIGAWDVLEGELTAQTKGRAAEAVCLPALTAEEVTTFKAALPERTPDRALIEALIDMQGSAVRVVANTQSGGGFIQYDITVPRGSGRRGSFAEGRPDGARHRR